MAWVKQRVSGDCDEQARASDAESRRGLQEASGQTSGPWNPWCLLQKPMRNNFRCGTGDATKGTSSVVLGHKVRSQPISLRPQRKWLLVWGWTDLTSAFRVELWALCSPGSPPSSVFQVYSHRWTADLGPPSASSFSSTPAQKQNLFLKNSFIEIYFTYHTTSHLKCSS